jgi:hypothetical protein
MQGNTVKKNQDFVDGNFECKFYIFIRLNQEQL